MGLDVSFQAMPDGCALLERARHDHDFGSYLEFFHKFSEKHPYGPAPSEAGQAFHQAAYQLALDRPGLRERRCSIGRTWDALHYLLSETRRNGSGRPAFGLIDEAIVGGAPLHEQTQTTIGVPIRWLTPDQVRAVVGIFAPVTESSLRTYYNSAAMYNNGVYKIHPNQDGSYFQHLWQTFDQLRTFYRTVAAHAEGVLHCTS